MIRAALAFALTASLLLALAAGAAAQGRDRMHMGNGKLQNIDTIYHAVLVKSVTGDSLTFDILSSAVKGKDGNVTSLSPAAPIPVQYFYANDTAVVAMKNKTGTNRTGRICPTRTDYNNGTIAVAGASAVVAMKNIQVLSRNNTSLESQISAFSVYLPDGTVKSYKLDTPIKAVKSWSDRKTTITGNPQFRADLQDAFKGTAKFPTNAAPLKIKDIDAKIK